MADPELASKLYKRCQIIEEDEEKNSKPHSNGALTTTTMMTSSTNDEPENFDQSRPSRPSIPPKPKNVSSTSNPCTSPSLVDPAIPKQSKNSCDPSRVASSRDQKTSSSTAAVTNGNNTTDPRAALTKKTQHPNQTVNLNNILSSDKPSIPPKPPRLSKQSRQNSSENGTPDSKSKQSSVAPLTTEVVKSPPPASPASENNAGEPEWNPVFRVWNPYTEFKEFSRKDIQKYLKKFQQYDVNKDKFLDFEELKYMMEKIGHPQTHLALKSMIREVDEDKDDKISFREFMLIFKKAKNQELPEESGLFELYRFLSEIDVEKEGIPGAKTFFEAKIFNLTHSNEFEEEIKKEQLEKKIANEEKRIKKAAFKETVKVFQRT